MTQATIGTQVIPILSMSDHALFVTNLGPGRIYYSKDIAVGVSNGTPLDKGNSIQDWPVGMTLYVMSPDGATITYENNGSTVAIGTTTATLTDGTQVGISPGASITATNRALTLFSSPNPIPIAVSTTPGNPSLSATMLYDSTGTDMSQFSTISFQLGGGSVAAIDPNAGAFYVLVQQFTSSNQLVKTENPVFLVSGLMRYQTQVVAPIIKISVYTNSNIILSILGGFTLIGLTAALPHMYFQSPGVSNRIQSISAGSEQDWSVSGYDSVTGTLASSTTGMWYPSTYSGQVTYSWRIANSASTSQVAFLVKNPLTFDGSDFYTSTPIVLTGATGGARSETGRMFLPELPIQVTMQNIEAANRAVSAALTYLR